MAEPPQIPEAELKKLIESYRQAVKDLAQKFVGNFSIDDNRVLGLVRDATRRLEDLDKNAAKWAKKNIPEVYDLARKTTAKELEKRGLSKRDASTARSFSVINHQAIEALVLDPELGFLSNLRGATDGVRNRLKQIHSQAKLLRSHQRVIDDVIARVGVLEGSTVDQVKRALVTELISSKKAADLVWRPKLERLGPNHIFANLANLPYVKAAGGRTIRLDRYAEMVARTKSRQATGVAQRNALLEHGRDLVMISRNQSKDDDACNLYVGRVFALTQEAAEREGVPHVDQLPGGGAPFHPNCTHNEIGFFPELMRKGVTERAMTSPPEWALGHTWAEVQREYEKRGGNAFGEEQNPNMVTAQDPGGRQRKIAAEVADARPPDPVAVAKAQVTKARGEANFEAKARKQAVAEARKQSKAREKAEAIASAEVAVRKEAQAEAMEQTKAAAEEAKAREKAEARALAEARERAVEAKARAEAEKKAQERAREAQEARREAEVEAKARAQAEARAEAASEARQKAEADAKTAEAARQEAESRAKASEEALEKAEAALKKLRR